MKCNFSLLKLSTCICFSMVFWFRCTKQWTGQLSMLLCSASLISKCHIVGTVRFSFCNNYGIFFMGIQLWMSIQLADVHSRIYVCLFSTICYQGIGIKWVRKDRRIKLVTYVRESPSDIRAAASFGCNWYRIKPSILISTSPSLALEVRLLSRCLGDPGPAWASFMPLSPCHALGFGWY